MNSGVVEIQFYSCFLIDFNRMQQKLNVMFKYFRVKVITLYSSRYFYGVCKGTADKMLQIK